MDTVRLRLVSFFVDLRTGLELSLNFYVEYTGGLCVGYAFVESVVGFWSNFTIHS